MSKKPYLSCAEWKELLIEDIFRLAYSEAYLEYYKDVKLLHKPRPSLPEFKQKGLSLLPKFARAKEQIITNKFKDYGKEFRNCFELAKSHLERGEDKGLEKIVQEWYDKLNQ